jgi:hypothetical protein
MAELAAKDILKYARNDPQINFFLPHLTDKAILNKEFLFNVINTVKPEFFP